MEGLGKRWDWGLDSNDSTYNYAIILSLDKVAAHYKFKFSKDDIVKPSEFYKCEKK